MAKKDIVKTVSEDMHCSQTLVKQIVQRTLDEFITVLAQDGRLELRCFGILDVKYRKGRLARNPRTGEKVQTEGRYVVTFKPGKGMTDTVNRAFTQRNAEKPSKKGKK